MRTAAKRTIGTVGTEDAERVRELVASNRQKQFVREREEYNVTGPVPNFSRDNFWCELMGCLLSTQQRSTKGSSVDRFLNAKPFTLRLEVLEGKDVRQFVLETLTAFGGIRRTNTIAEQASRNLAFLAQGGWKQAESYFGSLQATRAQAPDPSHIATERQAAHWAIATLAGIGPKQSRNLWQALGLTRFETPIDSRVTDWINDNLSVEIDEKRLPDAAYYEAVLDYVQQLCRLAGVLPCILDAAAFRYEGEESTTNQSVNKGTTKTGYLNRHGQIVIRDTGEPGTDFGARKFQLACTQCGQNYGANSNDIWERKCPKCQGGAAGLDLPQL